MNPINYLKVLILLPAFAGAVSPALSAPQSSKTGTYTFERGNGAGGVVMVKELSKDKIKFQIECNRGAPSYNVGAAEGTIEVKNNIAIYSANYPDYSEGGPSKCQLILHFEQGVINITQKGSDSDCGFGHAVYCDGSYKIRSHESPKFEGPR